MSRNTPHLDQKIRHVSWNKIQKAVIKITKKIQNRFLPDEEILIYGIPRGGMIPAIMVTHHLDKQGVRNRLVLNPRDLTVKELSSLVVIDDISDSGATFKMIKHAFPAAITVALFYRWGVGLVPEIYADGIGDEWIYYPWELQ